MTLADRRGVAPADSAGVAQLDPNRPRVLMATRDRVEMRAGPVRLLLLRPEPVAVNRDNRLTDEEKR